MKRYLHSFRDLILALAALAAIGGIPTLRNTAADDAPADAQAADPATPENPRERRPDDLAGNDEVERIIQTFPGRGEVGDDSEPTAADVAVTQFEMAEGLRIDLVAEEPVVEQPLYISFDPQGRMWVVQYRQYPFPAGLRVIHYDQHLRAVFDQVPPPPPNHFEGADKITVFEDTDGDGMYDAHRDVITGLNIATAVLTGYGGIWVLNPPYLMFYPDADGDANPDGDPVVHLSGFGLEDTHSVASSLRWGPEGWLYGANGSTTTGNVSSSVSQNIKWEGQCIWRYHPISHVFEIFAEGGGNTFSLEIDGEGRVFSGTNYGGTRGMFYPQGSYGIKGWGKHGPLTNPFAFGFFQHMRHEGDADRFPQTFVIYEGGTLPQQYWGNVIAANALHNRVWASEMIPDTSTYRTVDLPPVATTPDRWFRPVDVKVGPDGAVYLADWYDTRLTHVDPRDNWHRTSGRVYRIQSDAGDLPASPGDMTAMTDDELIAHFEHPNKVVRQHAVQVLGDRLLQSSDAGLKDTLRELAGDPASSVSLEALWALKWGGGFDLELAAETLAHPNEHVRRWSIRLLGDQRRINNELGLQLTSLAQTEAYVQVRTQLASSAQRFPAEYALPIIRELWQRSEDEGDLHQPLLLWWALEVQCEHDRSLVLELFKDPAVWDIPMVRDVVVSRLMQRFAMDKVAQATHRSIGVDLPRDAATEMPQLDGLTMCAEFLKLSPSPEHTQRLMAGFLEAYQGREVSNLPAELATAIQEYQATIGQSDVALALRLGQSDAVDQALQVVGNESADAATRLLYIEILGQIGEARAMQPLLGLLGSSSSGVKRAAMLALMNYTDDVIGSTICSQYQSSIQDEHGLRETAQRVLASRPTWTLMLLREVEEFRIKAEEVAGDVVQQMRLHQDEEIQQLLDKHWGRTRSTPEEKQQQIERLISLLRAGLSEAAGASDSAADSPVVRGYQVFKKNCAVCHTLFDEGGRTGPNLTGYERDNLDFMLLAIVDPSAAIREEFTNYQIATLDGLILTGLIDEQTPTTVTIRGANNETTIVNREEIDILQALDVSIMPDALTQKLTDQDLVDLFAYLVRRTPIPVELRGPDEGAAEE